jgi:hypothetical protein
MGILLAFSGHMGSGKDTVASPVVQNIPGPAIHGSFAAALRCELNAVIRIISESGTVFEAVIDTIMSLDGLYDAEAVESTVRALYDDVKMHGLDDISKRTPSTRYAMQEWGTEVRRSKDPMHWVNIIKPMILNDLSTGSTVYLTDARFPNELDAVHDLGGFIVRLNVSPEVQAERIMKRDGVRVTDEMRSHPSETAADDYPDFDLVVDTDDKTVDEITRIVVSNIVNESDKIREYGDGSGSDEDAGEDQA